MEVRFTTFDGVRHKRELRDTEHRTGDVLHTLAPHCTLCVIEDSQSEAVFDRVNIDTRRNNRATDILLARCSASEGVSSVLAHGVA